MTPARQGFRKIQLPGTHSHKPTVEIINKIIHVYQVFQLIYNLLTWASLLTMSAATIWKCELRPSSQIYTNTHIYMGHIINFTISQNCYLFIHSMAYLPNMRNLNPLIEPTVSVQG